MEITVRFNNVTELIIKDNSEYEFFYSFAEKLSQTLPIKYHNKLDDYDSLYWDFNYNSNKLTLHYNIYLGVSIFHDKGNAASQEENEILYSIKKILEENVEPESPVERGILSRSFKKLHRLLHHILHIFC